MKNGTGTDFWYTSLYDSSVTFNFRRNLGSPKRLAERSLFRSIFLLKSFRTPTKFAKELTSMKQFAKSGMMIFAGVLSIAAATAQETSDVTKKEKKIDLRESILRKFFKDNHCPAENYAGTFLREADSHGLDWRLLPSLSLVESGGGRTAKYNNLFGWANGKSKFTSISEAIHHVADVLAHGKSYEGKDLAAKLFTYNRRTAYKTNVMRVMAKIAGTPEAADE